MKLTQLLRSELVRTLSRDQHGATGRCGQHGAEGGGRGPADRPPERLIVERRAFGHFRCEESH